MLPYDKNREPWDRANLHLNKMGIKQPHVRMMTAAVAPLMWRGCSYGAAKTELHEDVYRVLCYSMRIEHSPCAYPLFKIVAKYDQAFYSDAENCRLLYNGLLEIVVKVEALYKELTGDEFYEHRKEDPLPGPC